MKTVKIILILIFTISIVLPNDKDFKRRSILSIEDILIKDEGLQSLSKVDYEVINSLIDYNIKVDRYKYDTIPSDMEAEFKINSGNLLELSIKNLSDLFIDDVNSKITSILNDQDVKQLRLSHLNDEFKIQTFMATKAKFLNVSPFCKFNSKIPVKFSFVSAFIKWNSVSGGGLL